MGGPEESNQCSEEERFGIATLTLSQIREGEGEGLATGELFGLLDDFLACSRQISHVLVEGFFFRRYAVFFSDDRTVQRQLQREDRSSRADPGSLVIVRVVDRDHEL